MTVLDSVIQGLDASTRFASSEVAPTAVLWTDAKSEWLPLLDQLKTRLPQLLVLGGNGSQKGSQRGSQKGDQSMGG